MPRPKLHPEPFICFVMLRGFYHLFILEAEDDSKIRHASLERKVLPLNRIKWALEDNGDSLIGNGC